ncbi:MAG: exo-alpha-sialidase [Crocinitomicaceae bacterium]|nr:exo-alpha-sialidase [Crocinitomicaceae bacterium]
MKRFFAVILMLASGINLSAQFENIQLPLPKKATYLYSQVEPSICINPKNTNEIIAGSVMNDYYWSADGGKTWKSKSVYSKWGVNGDPCMLIDTLERFYYFHLSNINDEALVGGMVCQRSNVLKGKFKYQGHTLANGKFHDKEWAIVNPANNHIYMTWTQFDAYDSSNPNDYSFIVFSKSEDGGLTWSDPIQISQIPGDCQDNDKTAEGAVPAIGPNGEIYVSWSRNDSLWFNYSTDDGKTWMNQEKFISTQPMGWVIDIPGIYRCNGLPVTTCDLSNSKHRGTIYVNWADQRNGENNTDIWLIKSNDQGKTWSKPKKVNTDLSQHHQFLTWMTIDQSNGNLYFVYYDRRDQEKMETDVYLSWSKDGGETFQDEKISASSFKPNPKIFFGDYTNISVHNGIIRPIWTRLHEGRITLWTALIDQSQLDKSVEQ